MLYFDMSIKCSIATIKLSATAVKKAAAINCLRPFVVGLIIELFLISVLAEMAKDFLGDSLAPLFSNILTY